MAVCLPENLLLPPLFEVLDFNQSVLERLVLDIFLVRLLHLNDVRERNGHKVDKEVVDVVDVVPPILDSRRLGIWEE